MAGYQNLYLNQGETFTTSITLDDSKERTLQPNWFHRKISSKEILLYCKRISSFHLYNNRRK